MAEYLLRSDELPQPTNARCTIPSTSLYMDNLVWRLIAQQSKTTPLDRLTACIFYGTCYAASQPLRHTA